MSLFKQIPNMIQGAIKEHEERYHKKDTDVWKGAKRWGMNYWVTNAHHTTTRICHCGECDYCVNLDARDIWGLM